MKTISALDLRHGLAIAFQPAVLATPEILLATLANYATFIPEHGITERRLDNAFSFVMVPDTIQTILKGFVK
mgnify:CR=1 FL=1